MKKLGHNIKQMFHHQILEEHIKKSKKHYNPCGDCIYDGIDKGYERASQDIIKLIDEFIKKNIGYGGVQTANFEKLKEYIESSQ